LPPIFELLAKKSVARDYKKALAFYLSDNKKQKTENGIYKNSLLVNLKILLHIPHSVFRFPYEKLTLFLSLRQNFLFAKSSKRVLAEAGGRGLRPCDPVRSAECGKQNL